MARPQQDQGRIARRVDLPASLPGLGPPPASVQAKLLRTHSGWTLLVRSRGGQAEAVEAWLRGLKPASVGSGPGLAPRVVRAVFKDLHPSLRALALPCVHHIDLTPAGGAAVFLDGTEDDLASFLAALGPAPEARSRPAGSMTLDISPRQLDVLAAAVALGYYDIPHRLTLRALAARLGATASSVSEVLRRAEATLIHAYVDSRSSETWEARFLDNAPPSPAAPGELDPDVVLEAKADEASPRALPTTPQRSPKA